MEKRLLRVIVAEDSVCATLGDSLTLEGTIEIIGVATTGAQVIALTHQLRPDAVVIDAGLRRVDAFEATRRIMNEVPTPIIIVAENLELNATPVSTAALNAGALAAIAKPLAPGTLEFAKRSLALLETVRTMAEVRLVRRWLDEPNARRLTAPRASTARPSVVGIAASTGGPGALLDLLGALPAGFPVPIVIVQHMARGFIDGLVRWLDDAVSLTVKVAEQGEGLNASTVYVSPDDRHMTVERSRHLSLAKGEPVDGHCPSATVLFRSVAAFGPKSVCVILTGMGNDGTDGLRAVRSAGGVVLAQDEASSPVFGMPRAAIDAGITDLTMAPKAIARYLTLAATTSLETV